MGWLWRSSTSTVEGTTAPVPSNISSEPQPPPVPAPGREPQPERPRRSPTRDELAEAELQSFLKELESDTRPSNAEGRSSQQAPRPQPPPPTPSNLTLEESLLPTDMSCRQAFDAAFYCQSMGGQFNNLYRYGKIRNCSENWRDFWFCMRTKGYPPEQKEGTYTPKSRQWPSVNMLA
jgi:hypothetical protein